jgi:AraC-like DNA-binding protein
VQRAIDLIKARYSEALHLDDIADSIGLTCFQAIRLFRGIIGLTPHAYLTQVRLTEACRLLPCGICIAEAATAASFYDQSAMTHHFRSCYVITPGPFVQAPGSGARQRQIDPARRRAQLSSSVSQYR